MLIILILIMTVSKHRNMAFIKEETEDFRIEEVFSLKQEDFEEQTGWFSFSMHLILIKMLP